MIAERLRLKFVAPLRPKTPPKQLTGDLAFLPMEAIGDDGTYAAESVRPAEEVSDSGYTYFEQGDVVRARITPCFENGKGALLSDLAGGCGLGTTELFVFKPSPRIDARFLYYVTASREFTGLGTATIYGAHGVRRVDEGFARDYRVWLPPLANQHAIADYLDRETARIDAVIAAKRRMVELLEERFRVAVSGTTADGQPTMLRRVITLRTTGPRGWGDLVADVGEPFIRSANLRRDDIELQTEGMARLLPTASREATRSRTRPGDVLMGVTGANTGWVGVVRNDCAHGYVSQHVAILRPSAALLPEWLGYSLFSQRVQDQLLAGQYGGTKQQLGLEDLAEISICVPSPDCQAMLVARLNHVKRVNRGAIATATQQVVLLQERRQALITAAVTGQLDIPAAA